ncbi:hypothetical protein PUNSTDRAFT_70671 [Punctularia strigosozonata HHB-11173 SS5]|uniref:uncharacterized protein n=1 Tax=Punctularia strigosozonata (strain HHB-11173) TaxID=741275 RepID=UPI0004417D86|nr:uncharacterized protein PUNSTDRAFT_70671 [Punctularia strigosozonata HHB-11173 SS5]EIN06937.1 hypothetical protein PUNSTDRAFT_70671 [Punctularia strigosozonata HHB-11173 SS5]
MRGFTNRSLKSVDVVAASGRVVGRRKGKRTRAKGTYNFEAANDIVGIVTLDIQGATDLPRLKNITRTGWDMDPFVVISFGKKVFRTRVIRHSLNPVWDEKLLFHVRRYETNFNVQLTVLDWDKLTSNDYVGEVQFNVSELLGDTPKKDELTGLYDAEELEKSRVARGKEFNLRLKTEKEAVWEAKHNPTLSFRAKYQAYDALRQQFWRKYLKQYDADDTDTISRLELTSMLDSLGSTLSASTVDSFFASHGKSPARDELTITEAVQCLEDELRRPEEERERVDSADYRPPDTGFVTPTIPGAVDGLGLSLALDKMSFAGPPGNLGEDGIGPSVDPSAQSPVLVQTFPTEPSEMVLGDPALNGRRENIKDRRRASADLSVLSPPSRRLLRQEGYSSGSEADYDPSPSTTPGTSISHPLQQGPPSPIFERVINVKNCPLCHRPRLSKKAEVDIITHLAICASQDWDRVDRIMVGNFVTPSQAQRKWYTKLVGKVSRGAYQLGANSANIIVQNRLTGQLEEEKMQVYVRLGIRLLYKGAKSTMEGARARRLLKSMTIKQGIKFDSPESARDIIPFIRFHRLNTEEFLDPVESYRTFNQFFYRRLKPGSRPVESPNDPTRLVSCADCRLMTFETVSEATRLWIKGREFTVGRLFGPGYRNLAERYAGGALAIFRLAPQDYHRFHSPVDGVIGAMSYIAGEYHTVNPQAIRTGLDVYGENARKVVPIDSPQFGKVMAVCVGATMVGSIITTVQEGQQVKRGDEFGYFAFGGSTIVIVFEKGVVDWDEDLLVNGRASLETLVRVGMGIGRCRRPNTRTQSSTS